MWENFFKNIFFILHLGVAISFPPAKLHCILSDFRQVTKALARPAISEPQPLLAASDTLSPRISSQMNKEPFDRHIAQILQRNTNNPIMRAPTDASLSRLVILKKYHKEYEPKTLVCTDF